MAGRPLALVLALPLLLAGCVEEGSTGTSSTSKSSTTTSDLPPPPTVAWTTIACDRSGATTTAIDAELVPGLRGEAAAIASQIGQTLGDPVAGPPEEYEDTGAMAYPTRSGGSITVQVGRPLGAVGDVPRTESFQGASYMGNATWRPRDIHGFAQALGAEESSLRNQSVGPRQGRVWQEWAGRPVYGGGMTWGNATGQLQLSLGPLYLMRAPYAAANLTKVSQDAEAYMRCYLDSKGSTVAKGWGIRGSTVQGFGVANRTLAYMVHVRFSSPVESPCGEYDARWVYVDAWTGAIKMMSFATC